MRRIPQRPGVTRSLMGSHQRISKRELERRGARPGASGMKMSVAGCVLDLACEALIDAEGKPVDLRPQAARSSADHDGRAIWPGLCRFRRGVARAADG